MGAERPVGTGSRNGAGTDLKRRAGEEPSLKEADQQQEDKRWLTFLGSPGKQGPLPAREALRGEAESKVPLILSLTVPCAMRGGERQPAVKGQSANSQHRRGWGGGRAQLGKGQARSSQRGCGRAWPSKILGFTLGALESPCGLREDSATGQDGSISGGRAHEDRAHVTDVENVNPSCTVENTKIEVKLGRV